VKLTDSNTPLHLLQPDYEIAYEIPIASQINSQLEKIVLYLEKATPVGLEHVHNKPLEDASGMDKKTKLKQGDFRLTSYEWGVTYSAMLHAAEVLKDARFSTYTQTRLNFIEQIRPACKILEEQDKTYKSPLHSVLHPKELDDAGALCSAMIKAQQVSGNANYAWMIDNFADFISHKQFRFPDGTFARNRPHPNTLWIDDLYMSVPALAQLGCLRGETRYFDDAITQLVQFSDRMFCPDIGLFMHGWVLDMKQHPEFFWGRANGWALLAMVELLEVLPESYEGRNGIVEIFNVHIQGLTRLQSGSGFWHQLLNRQETYYETSATAIFTYALTWAINHGYLDAAAYGPAIMLAWNAINSRIQNNGQIEGTCVGTGMGFDPAFYVHRPVSVFAAHGYGPVLMAGSEIIRFLGNYKVEIVENAFQVHEKSMGLT
jgi:rhamnogalacturonyl hydrolase YesR